MAREALDKILVHFDEERERVKVEQASSYQEGKEFSARRKVKAGRYEGVS